MNRAERRRHAADNRRRTKEWQDFHADTGGAFRLSLHRRDQFDLVAFFSAWLAGDLQVTALDIAYRDLAKAAAERRLPDCLACGVGLSRMPDVIAVMLAERPDPSSVMASGICPGCARMTDAEITAIVEKLLRRTWPELRVVDSAQISSAAGRA
jgi:hypothetical protein